MKKVALMCVMFTVIGASAGAASIDQEIKPDPCVRMDNPIDCWIYQDTRMINRLEKAKSTIQSSDADDQEKEYKLKKVETMINMLKESLRVLRKSREGK